MLSDKSVGGGVAVAMALLWVTVVWGVVVLARRGDIGAPSRLDAVRSGPMAVSSVIARAGDDG